MEIEGSELLIDRKPRRRDERVWGLWEMGQLSGYGPEIWGLVHQ